VFDPRQKFSKINSISLTIEKSILSNRMFELGFCIGDKYFVIILSTAAQIIVYYQL